MYLKAIVSRQFPVVWPPFVRIQLSVYAYSCQGKVRAKSRKVLWLLLILPFLLELGMSGQFKKKMYGDAMDACQLQFS